MTFQYGRVATNINNISLGTLILQETHVQYQNAPVVEDVTKSNTFDCA